ncbi:general secretion pathway protein GspK [Haloferula helveola]|uniref:General secretion pathway protein GspK n=1 Tax=Haloferula helveola TaxID=490095 RepID=A0ABN6HB67_9BACT|nr:general secretion pathway protein GspK [Haloferula helveola]
MIWLIALLSFITVATIRVVGFDLDVAAANIHGFRAKQLAEMGVAVGANPVVERGDPILNQWSEENGEGFEVRLTSEGGKFNINQILLKEDKNLLKMMFADWGLDIDQAAEVADALGDWIDGDDEVALNGAEITYYEDIGRVNQPFNRPFYSLDEMRLVKGMDLVEAYQPDWRSWFTIWSSGGLDINEAPAEMIAVAAEVSYEEALIIPETVRGPDGERDTDDDTPFQNAQEALALIGVDGSLRGDISARFSVNETTTRIESIGSAPGAKRKITLVVRNRTGQPAILERTEEVIP